MKSASVLIAGLIFGLVILGIASLNSSLIVLAIPLLAYLFAAVWQRPEEVLVRVSRQIWPDYAPQGAPINVRLTLENQGPPIDELMVRDLLPEGVRHLDGSLSLITTLESGDRFELEYTIEARRGAYDIYEVAVQARDFLGLFERPQLYRTTPRLVVHPRFPKLDRIKIHPPQTRGFAGPIAARQPGTGIDFWSVREYQSGDPQRHINWRRSARAHNELFTNIFEQERVADVGLILDTRQRANVLTGAGSLFEHSVAAAAALAENFLSDGNRVSLLIYGSEMARVFPGYGRVHQDRILKALSRANPGVNYALESLNHMPTRLFPAQSQIVMVSPLLPEDIASILRMRAQGYAVMVISPDPIAFEAALYGDYSSPAYRMAHAERDFLLRQARRSEVQIVNWRVDQPLETAVRETLAHQRVGSPILRIAR